MKKLILLMVAAMFASFSFSQVVVLEKDVPTSVKNELKKRHPNVNTAIIKWEKNRTEYIANFTENGSHYTVEFDEKGNAHRTKLKLKEHEVPAYINDYASKNYPEEKFREVEKIVDRDGKVSYSMRLKDSNHHFDADGNYVKDKERVHIKEKVKVKN